MEFDQARRQVEWDHLYKTDVCQNYNFVTNTCPYGDKCRFVHPGDTQNSRPPISELQEKIKEGAWRITEIRQVVKPRVKPRVARA